MRVVRVSRTSLADEVYAEFHNWPKVRYALYSFFRNCAEVARMVALYGERKYDPNNSYPGA